MSAKQKIGLHQGKPNIVICRTDRERLTKLAEAISDRSPEIAEELLVELDRADVVDDGDLPGNIARMGASVRYRADEGPERHVSLVYPGEADISLGRISILTPIGTALLGLSAGQSIDWVARDERRHHLTVVSVEVCNPVETGKV
ncbi:MAG: nucleoside diphosphate kinase regulator [Rhizobium sp.]|nr:MAG: nucleoside diphosphate kinase regulator [Rhizobium sp.]